VTLPLTHGDRLAAAKLWLISATETRRPDAPRDLPYLAHALYALVPVASREVPRMTCDEHWRVYVNTDWLEAATVRAIGAELVHLSWHLLHDHAARARDQRVDAVTADAWKHACDIAIEHALRPDGLVPEGMPTADALGFPSGLSAEQYYATLSRLPAASGEAGDGAPTDAGCGSGCDGLARGHELPPGLDVGEIGHADARHIRRLVAITFARYSQAKGRTSLFIDSWHK